MRGRGTIRATRIRGLAEPRRSDGDEVEVLFTKLKRGRLVTARNHFCRDESGCEGEAGKPMTMVAASCGGPRRIESRRCSSITCAANGSRERGRRWSDLTVRAGRGGPPEQAPVSARPGPVGSVGPGRAALTKWEVVGESTDRAPETSGTVVRYRAEVTAAGAGAGHRVGRLPCVTNLGLLLPRGGRLPGSGILPGDELLVDPLVQCIGRPGARNLLGDDDDVGLPRRRLPRRRRQGRHLWIY